MDPPADGEEGQEESKEQDEDEQEENHAKGEPGQKQVDAAGGQCVDGVWFPPGWKVDERVRVLGGRLATTTSITSHMRVSCSAV